MGVVFFILSMVPFVVILDDSEFYIGEFVKNQREKGGDIEKQRLICPKRNS